MPSTASSALRHRAKGRENARLSLFGTHLRPPGFGRKRTMHQVVLGTAGHIDHGKTSLIRALTGIDTDRLKEEKQRGITIELGFAYLDLPDGT